MGMPEPSTLNQPYFQIRADDTAGLNVDDFDFGENVDATIGTGFWFRIRFAVTETAGGNNDNGYKLQFNKNSTGWVDVGLLSDTACPAVVARTSNQYADGALIDTRLLSGSGTWLNGEGYGDNTGGNIVITSQETEFEWCLQILGFYDGYNQNQASDTIDFRVVEGNGTAFTGTYVNPTITVSETAGHIGGTMIETPHNIGPIKDSNGNLYTFIESSPNSNRLMCIKSTDGGDTWREIDGTNRPTTGDVEALDVTRDVSDSDILHILHHSTTTVEYYKFHMSGAASTPDTWRTADFSQVRSGISGLIGQQAAAIVQRSDGDLIAIYNTYNATDAEDELNYKIDTGTGWGSEQILEDETGYEWHWASAVIGASDLCHIFYKGDNNTLGPIWHKSLNSSDTLSGREAIDSDAESNTEYEAALTEAVYWDDSGEENILVVYLDADNKLYSVNVRDDGTPDTRRAASDNTCARGETATYGDSRSCVASMALDGTTVYLFYADNTDRHIWYDTMTNDGGWTTDIEFRDDADHANGWETHWIRGKVFTHSSGNGGAKVYGFIWDNASGGGCGQIWYDEFVIQAAGAAPPPRRQPLRLWRGVR